VDGDEATPYLLDAIRLVRREVAGKQAIIGFAGAPFTLACYLVEGHPSRDYSRARQLMFAQPAVWHALLEKLALQVTGVLRAQARAGAQALQLFDSWVGVLGPQDYTQYVLPHMRRVFAGIADLGVPAIHFGTGTATLLERMAQAGGELLGVDWRIPLDDAWARVGYDRGIQGNLDPALLLAPFEQVEAGMHDVLRRAAGRPGHIFNLGHGVLPETPPEHLARLVAAVHQATRRTAGM
jgi:uroporphyrinogen decarboxylase